MTGEVGGVVGWGGEIAADETGCCDWLGGGD